MKKLEIFKTIQLFILIIMAAICFYIIVLRTNIYHLIASSNELKLMCILLWGVLLICFFFIFLDLSMFSKQKNTMNALDYAAHSDPLAKIANRQGCDELIEQYIDKPLPPDMGCIMIFLSSLNEINRNFTRKEGNQQIRNFSIILKLASVDKCFVGRNGGNVFMAIFEETSKDTIDIFLERIEQKVIEYNQDQKNLPMYYKFGTAFHEDAEVNSINGLISLANRRAQDATNTPDNIEITKTSTKDKNATEISASDKITTDTQDTTDKDTTNTADTRDTKKKNEKKKKQKYK